MAAIPGSPEWIEEQKKRRQAPKPAPIGAIFGNNTKNAATATALSKPKSILSSMFQGKKRGPGPDVKGFTDSLRDNLNRNVSGISGDVIGGITPGVRSAAKGTPQAVGALGIASLIGQLPPSIGKNYRDNVGEPSIPTFGKTLADYLKIYGDGKSLAAPILKDIDARSEALKERGSEGDAQIESAYSALQKSLQLAKEDEAERYKEAQFTAGQNSEAAQGAIQAAREGSKEGRDTIRANLGMEDIPMSTSEGHAAEAGANDVSRSASLGLSQQDYLQNVGNSRQDYMGSNKTAAGFAGAEMQSALQRDLMDRLGGLDSEKAGVLSDAQLQAQQLAMQAYNSDYGAFTDDRNFSANRDDTAWSRAIDETNMYSSYQQAQAEAQQRAQQASLEAQTAQQEAQSRMSESQAKNTPAYARTADRLRQNLGQSAPQGTLNNVLNYYAKAASDPERFPLNVDELIGLGLSPEDAVFAMQEGREYLKAYA